jgi:hypothetical protein
VATGTAGLKVDRREISAWPSFMACIAWAGPLRTIPVRDGKLCHLDRRIASHRVGVLQVCSRVLSADAVWMGAEAGSAIQGLLIEAVDRQPAAASNGGDVSGR